MCLLLGETAESVGAFLDGVRGCEADVEHSGRCDSRRKERIRQGRQLQGIWGTVVDIVWTYVSIGSRGQTVFSLLTYNSSQ